MREEEGGSFAPEILISVRNTLSARWKKPRPALWTILRRDGGLGLSCRMVVLFPPLPKSSRLSLILGGGAQEDMM